MRNQHIERLEAKLKLWDTPGFSQFLQELDEYTDVCGVALNAEALRAQYKSRLTSLKEDTKFKQGKLEI